MSLLYLKSIYIYIYLCLSRDLAGEVESWSRNVSTSGTRSGCAADFVFLEIAFSGDRSFGCPSPSGSLAVLAWVP
jgi:hypothetical protein